MVNFIYFLLYSFVFIFGACIGSFLNVVIYRLPKRISVAEGRSFCPNCKNQIKNYDLIPILSYIFLRGKCRNCKDKISPRYPLIEAFVGVIAVLIFIQYYFTAKALLAFAFCAVLFTTALIDHDALYIPNSLIFAVIPLSILSVFVFKDISTVERIIGFFAVSIPMFIMIVIIPGSFGGGDIKLMAVSGYFLGWKIILLATFIAILIEGVYVIIKMALKKLKKEEHIAFGPALCTGMFISLLYGEKIFEVYLKLIKFE